MERDLSLSFWIGAVLKHKFLIFLFVALVVALTFFWTRRQPKIYEATTRIVIELEAPRYMAQQGSEVVSLGAGRAWDSTEFLETQFRIIRSRKVAEWVVEMGCDPSRQLPKALSQRSWCLREDFDFLGLTGIEDPAQREAAFQSSDPASLLVAGLTVDPVAHSHVVYLKYRDTNPERAQLLADAIAYAYMEINLKDRDVAVGNAVRWLQEKESELFEQLQKDEEALLAFKKDHNLLAGLDEQQRMNSLDLQEAQRELRLAKNETQKAKAEWQEARSLSLEESSTSLEIAMSNGLVQRLKERIVSLQNERTELLRRYLEKHPDVEAADAKIARVREALNIEIAGIRQGLEHRYQAAVQKERSWEAEVARIEGEARSLHSLERQYKLLESAIESSKALYLQMQMRLKEAELQEKTTANNVSILENARLPKVPVLPRKMLNMAVALVLGLLGGVFLGAGLELIDTTVKSQEQIEGECEVTFLGMIPSVRSDRGKPVEPDRYVLDCPTGSAAEFMRTVRTNLQFMNAKPDALHTLVVTSANPEEGKTATSLNLAAAMALGGSKVLLVDADLRRPRVKKIFEAMGPLDRDLGLSDYALALNACSQGSGAKPDLEDYVLHVPLADTEGVLDVLFAGHRVPNPAEFLQGELFSRALESVKSAYSCVLFDSSPVNSVSDVLVLARQVDGAVLVARFNRTQQGSLQMAVRSLKDVQAHIFGAILNDVDLRKRGYGAHYYSHSYKYGYGYGYKYGYGYGYGARDERAKSDGDARKAKT